VPYGITQCYLPPGRGDGGAEIAGVDNNGGICRGNIAGMDNDGVIDREFKR